MIDTNDPNIDKIKSKSTAEKLKINKQMALFSKSLSTIRLNVPVKIDLKQLDWQNHFNMEKVRELFGELGFNTLLRRLPGGERQTRQPDYRAGRSDQ